MNITKFLCLIFERIVCYCKRIFYTTLIYLQSHWKQKKKIKLSIEKEM